MTAGSAPAPGKETRPAEAGGAAPGMGGPAAIADLFPLRVTSLPNRYDPIIQIESPPRPPLNSAPYVLAIFNARMPLAEQQVLAEFLVDAANAEAAAPASAGRVSPPPPPPPEEGPLVTACRRLLALQGAVEAGRCPICGKPTPGGGVVYCSTECWEADPHKSISPIEQIRQILGPNLAADPEIETRRAGPRIEGHGERHIRVSAPRVGYRIMDKPTSDGATLCGAPVTANDVLPSDVRACLADHWPLCPICVARFIDSNLHLQQGAGG